MRKRTLLVVLFTLAGLLAGCGGGSSSTGAVAPPGSATPSSTTLSGVAAEGIVRGGTVNIYAPPASGDLGGKILLKTTTTDDSGAFSADLGNYSGVVVIEVSGNQVYTSEATGNTESISASAPLRGAAVVDSAGQAVPVTVTPLTELALRKALTGSSLTGDSVKAANALVSNLFQFDIMATRPVAPELPAVSAAPQAQKDYTIALAAFSELAAAAGSPGAVIDGYYHDLVATGRLAPATVGAFQSAAGTFLSDSAHNQTGITALSPALAAVGKYTGTLTLATQGTASAPITSMQLTLTLPPGVTLKRDAGGDVMVTASGVAGNAAAFGKNYLAPDTLVLAIISSPGFAVGEFATITYLADPGSIPTAGDFKVSNTRISGFDGSNDFDIALNIVPQLP